MKKTKKALFEFWSNAILLFIMLAFASRISFYALVETIDLFRNLSNPNEFFAIVMYKMSFVVAANIIILTLMILAIAFNNKYIAKFGLTNKVWYSIFFCMIFGWIINPFILEWRATRLAEKNGFSICEIGRGGRQIPFTTKWKRIIFIQDPDYCAQWHAWYEEKTKQSSIFAAGIRYTKTKREIEDFSTKHK